MASGEKAKILGRRSVDDDRENAYTGYTKERIFVWNRNGRREQMKLYIVRHGETDWNKSRRVQGFSDIPLNDYGIYLAGETAKGLRDVGFDLAYTSPLIRAKKTAEVILGSRETPLIEDAAIKEMGFGVYEGMCISGEAKARESAEFNKFFTDTAHFIPARGGESVEGLLARTGAFLQELCASEENKEKTILLSTHGAAMTALVNHVKGNLETADFWKEGVPPNCAVTLVEVENKKPEIVFENRVYYKEAVRAWTVD